MKAIAHDSYGSADVLELREIDEPRVGPDGVLPGAEGAAGDLRLLADLLESGEIRPVVDRTYPLSEVPDAVRNLAEGHASGKIVIRVADPAPSEA